MTISAKWKHKSAIHIGFIVFNGGVTTFLAKSVSNTSSYCGKEFSHQWRNGPRYNMHIKILST